ncbi:MAG: NYN domain-containing protein [Pirellulales bacterium]
MRLLIDGYNLLFASGIVGEVRGARGGESSRLALLDFLAEVVPTAVAARTTIVFDAADAPPGLPAAFKHRGIQVRFARHKQDADALLEDLIEQATDPRQLTVVSSDHRVQRAARRRGATYLDSEIWYAERLRERRSRAQAADASDVKPEGRLSREDVAGWLREFGLRDAE